MYWKSLDKHPTWKIRSKKHWKKATRETDT